MTDTLPLWFAIPAIIVAWIGVIVLAVRDSIRYYESTRAQDPVVVTGSGIRSNRYPRSCGGVR
ncbi:hypothetical protein [Microbacterium sp. NPDC087592]|uniref:hypothetical protein n=1 Tax=Microbacterium sp. NPDC087592 TaxID=3364193 RepID=UPI0038208A22